MLCHHAECHYDGCCVLFIVMLSVIMLSVGMLSDEEPNICPVFYLSVSVCL
jgi:hypothetical protein